MLFKIILTGGFYVELSGKQFCMISDKEQMLQILHLNNVPSVELVDPKTCTYPIIGRKYGHHGGKDLTIIHTQGQAIDGGFDFYTKLYAFEEEYILEIQGLDVKSVRIAVAQQLVFYEVPIRTEVFGWIWKEINISCIPTDWLDIAIRALYVTGLTNGFVKIVEESKRMIKLEAFKERMIRCLNKKEIPFLTEK